MKNTVFSHVDYRSYLVTHFEDAKKRNPSWSYQAWAKKLGLKNNTSLLKIIHGQRDAGPEILEKLLRYFRFGVKERAYFEDLVRLSKVKGDPELSLMVKERLEKRRPTGPFILLDVKTFSAISHWWYYAIRQLTRLPGFLEDPQWIAQRLRFKVNPRDIARALDTMLQLNLLERDPKTKRLRITAGKGIQTLEDISQEGLKRFHEGALALAQEAVRTVPVEKRQISSITLAVSTAKIPQMKDFIRRMEDEFVRQFSETGTGDAVYQIQTQLFPLTQYPELSHENKIRQ